MQFSVGATSADGPVPVHQSALDLPINAATLHVPAGGAAALATPIRLRIAEGAGPDGDPFLWSIPGRREELSLYVSLDLPPPFAIGCRLGFS